MPQQILIQHATIFTGGSDPALLEDGSILIEGGLIKSINPDRNTIGKDRKNIDANGMLVVPGFINAHTHCYSAFARGFGKSKPAGSFNEILKNLWWRLDSALTLEDCYFSAIVTFIESIRHGTTTIIDHHASPGAVHGSLPEIELAAIATGVRACLCYEVSDRDGEIVSQEGLRENAEFLQDRGNSQVKGLFGLHASFTLSDATLERASRLAADSGAGFHIHVAEAESDQQETMQRFGSRVVQRLKKFGILGPDSIAAHCVHIDNREMDLLAESKTMVVHNPQSNLNNAVGIARVSEMIKRDVRVGLGTDAMTTNMLEEVRVALWSQHHAQNNPSSAFNECATMLFRNNPSIAGRVFQIPVGTLGEGAVADLAIIDYHPYTPMDESTIMGHLVYGGSQCPVDTTIVDGRVLMEHRRLMLNIDEEQINARARELAAALWKRM